MICHDTTGLFFAAIKQGHTPENAQAKTCEHLRQMAREHGEVRALLDSPAPWRRALDPTYRADRAALMSAGPIFDALMDAVSKLENVIPIIDDGMDAVDLVARMPEPSALFAVDKRMNALVGPWRVLRNSKTGPIELTADGLKKHAVSPELFPDFLALQTIDGVGETIAKKLLETYGSALAAHETIRTSRLSDLDLKGVGRATQEKIAAFPVWQLARAIMIASPWPAPPDPSTYPRPPVEPVPELVHEPEPKIAGQSWVERPEPEPPIAEPFRALHDNPPPPTRSRVAPPPKAAPKLPEHAAVTRMPPKLAAALIRAQRSCDRVEKMGWNDHHKFNYATCEAMIAQGSSALNSAGLALMVERSEVQPTRELPDAQVNGKRASGSPAFLIVRYLLVHEDGDSFAIERSLPIHQDSGKGIDKATLAAFSELLAYTLRDLLLIERTTDVGTVSGRNDRSLTQ